MTFNYSTLSGNRVTNSSGARGGAIYTRVGNLSFTNSTISGNSAATGYGYGGGIYVKQNNDPITMQQTTIASNTAGKRGGGLMIMTSGSGAVTINGSLFANTIAPSGGGGNIDIFTGSIAIAGSNNLVFPGAPPPSDVINATFANAPLTGNPKLTPLGNFGGTTQTRVPMAGSAAIDAGSHRFPDSARLPAINATCCGRRDQAAISARWNTTTM